MSNAAHPTKTVFFIGKEKFEVDTDHLTPRQILVDFAHEDPAENTLATRHGNDTEKFTNLDTPIELKDGEKFFVLHEGPTGVS